jgi:hypothetical protein
MAQLIDPKPEDQQETEEFATLEEQEEIQEDAEKLTLSEPEEAEEDDGIPDKYRGKDIKDIVQMHQEAEKLLGRQSSEVGELRKIVDDFVKSQIQSASSPQQETDEEIDFFVDPEKAIAKAIENHPKFKETEQFSLAMKQQQVLAQLQNNHPDFIDIVQDKKFQDWVAGSKVRTELYTRADKQFDFDSADELITTWKERQNMVTETAKVQKEDRKRQLKAASTGSASGSTEAPSRKIYRRADIIKLMQTDPKRYTQLQPEILAAYAEGRVK